MSFNIPMSTSGAMDSSSLLSLNSGKVTQNNNQQQAQQQQVQQQQVQQQPNIVKSRPQGNGVILKKGQKHALSENGTSLNNIQICLGWTVLSGECDLDTSAFMLTDSGLVLGDDWFVFYGQPISPDGSIKHSGDSKGQGDGDDEIIDIQLNNVNANISKICFVVTIDEALEKNLNFGMVSDAYVRVVNKDTGNELVKFMLTDYYSTVTSMVLGEIYRHNGEWKFNAVGDGTKKDLAGLCEMYGVNVAG